MKRASRDDLEAMEAAEFLEFDGGRAGTRTQNQRIKSPRKRGNSAERRCQDKRVLGVTATPQRLDGKGLAEWFDDLICGPSVRELIDASSRRRTRLGSQPGGIAQRPTRRARR